MSDEETIIYNMGKEEVGPAIAVPPVPGPLKWQKRRKRKKEGSGGDGSPPIEEDVHRHQLLVRQARQAVVG